MARPSRSDEIYKEIESFEEYELTQCVAYEMAVRNEDILKAIDECIKFYNDNKESIFYQDDEGGFNSEKYSYSEFLLNTLKAMIEDIPFIDSCYGCYFVCFRDKRINNEFYKIVDELDKKEFNGIDEDEELLNINNNVTLTSNGLTESKTIHSNIERKGYSIDHSITVSIESYVYDENIEDYKDASTIEDIKRYLYDEGNINDAEASISIIEKFKRPKLVFYDDLKSINVNLLLDINKPLNELIAYITHIKKDLEENQNILKAPIELLGENLQKADDISKMCIKNKNGKKFCFDGRNGVTKTQKFADMFFIYDMNKLEVKESKIRVMIDEHYDPNNEKKSGMSQDTFRKYLHIAKDYIDNQRYKEIITGIKP